VASKFQNRLVGTIIIVALGVIVLPGLLDGKKKHYQDEFAAIPLVPKPGDTDETETSPQANQALPSQPPEGAGAAVEQANKTPETDEPTAASAADNAEQPTDEQPAVTAPAPKKASVPRMEPAKPAAKPTPAPPGTQSAKSEPKPAVSAQKPDTSTASAQPAAEQPPKGQAWIVQLGALKNASRVEEVVAKLRLSGYRVYTLPPQPVAGQITRIFVGPEASKQKLQDALAELNQLSGLNGQLRSYQVH